MQLGKLGVWASMDVMTAAEGAAFAQRVEGWGYAALWLPESRGRNVLAHSAWLLANTSELIIAPGIANIYARDPMAMANGQRGLNEQSGGRFLLGIGVSHAPTVTGLRGHTYGKPVATMRAYLEAMHAAPYLAPDPPERPLTILAALGPRMMALSGELADAEKARSAARQALAPYMRLDNYVNNWRRLGFGDEDFADGGSARFIDANVAWGTEAAIRQRIQEHWDAGADHVCIQSISPDGSRRPDEKILAMLAPGSGR